MRPRRYVSAAIPKNEFHPSSIAGWKPNASSRKFDKTMTRITVSGTQRNAPTIPQIEPQMIKEMITVNGLRFSVSPMTFGSTTFPISCAIAVIPIPMIKKRAEIVELHRCKKCRKKRRHDDPDCRYEMQYENEKSPELRKIQSDDPHQNVGQHCACEAHGCLHSEIGMNVAIDPTHDSNSVFPAFGIRKQRLNLDRKEASFKHDKQAINQDERDVLQDDGHLLWRQR